MIPRVIIIGGGISGLTAAYRLEQAAASGAPMEVTLIEKDDRLGGKIQTRRIHNCVVEEGAESFLARKPWALNLCNELGIHERLQGTRPETRRTYILKNQSLHQIPEGLTGLIPTRIGPLFRTPLLSLPGKLRVLIDYLIPAGREREDETVSDFVSRRIGREVFDRMIEPLLCGIYAGKGNELSLQATFPNLRRLEVEHGGLIRGLLAGSQKQPSNEGSPFLTFPEGMSELIQALRKSLNQVQILQSVRAEAVIPDSSGFRVSLENGREQYADAVLITTPSYITAEIIAGASPALKAVLEDIPHVTTATLTLGFRKSELRNELRGYGYVVPMGSGRNVTACTWTSSKHYNRCPEETVLVRLYFGRSGEEEKAEVADEQLLAWAQEEMESIMNIQAKPIFHHVRRWKNGSPQYTLGHPQRLENIEAQLKHLPGIYLSGASYRGVGIPDCVNNASRAVDRMLTFLKSKTTGI